MKSRGAGWHRSWGSWGQSEELEELLAQDLREQEVALSSVVEGVVEEEEEEEEDPELQAALAKAKAASEGLRRLARAGMLLRSDSEEVWEEYVEEEEQNFEPEPEEPEPEPRSEFAEEEGQSRVFDPGRTTSCV